MEYKIREPKIGEHVPTTQSWFVDEIRRMIADEAGELTKEGHIFTPTEHDVWSLNSVSKSGEHYFIGATVRGINTVVTKLLQYGQIPKVEYIAKQDRFYTAAVPFTPFLRRYNLSYRLPTVPAQSNNGNYLFASVTINPNLPNSSVYLNQLRLDLNRFPVTFTPLVREPEHHLFLAPSTDDLMNKRFYDTP